MTARRSAFYILDELYEKGLTNTQLAGILREWVGQHYITCDSAEPKSIKELQNYGIRAVGAKKGPDSVIHGIQWLQGQEMHLNFEPLFFSLYCKLKRTPKRPVITYQPGR